MSAQNKTPKPGRFIWNELVAAKPDVAKRFYASLFGWKPKAFGKNAPGYTLFKTGKDSAGGMMKCPAPGLPSHWLSYVLVKDVDASVKKAKKLGAKVCVEAFDVKTVGHIAVLCDPQGAAFGVFTPEM